MAQDFAQQKKGERLLPHLYDHLAITKPDAIFTSVMLTDDAADGFHDITYKEFAQGIDRCAHWLEKELGKGKDLETLAYFGPQDMRYPIFVLGCCKAGYKALICSPRNSLIADLTLLEGTKCNTLVVATDAPPIVEELTAESKSRRLLSVPEESFFLDKNEPQVPNYTYDKTFEEVRSKPLAVFHTSGSTGIPKPVYVAHGSFTSQEAFLLFPELGLPPTWWSFVSGKRWLMGFPFYHFASYVYLLAIAGFGGMETVLGPTKKVLNLDAIASASRHAKIQGAVLTPSLVIDLVKDEEHFESLCKLDFILYTGGSLPRDIGNVVAQKLQLFTVVGTTENAGFPVEAREHDKDSWDYLKFSPYFGCRFEQYDDTRYELIHVRDPKLRLFQGVFATFPDVDEFPTKDLYSKHPTKEGYWKHRGRADDIITFLTAEKLNPIDMEAEVSTHPDVDSALVVGQGKFHSAILIEPKRCPKTPEERTQLLDKIWPAIEAANKDCPAFARILEAFVLFTTAEKPMVRTEKGTVIRYKTIKSYESEIESLYETNAVPQVTASKEEILSNSIRDTLVETAESVFSGRHVGDHDNLFELGIDSLGVMMLAKSINTYVMALKPKAEPIPITTLYRYPTIALIEHAVQRFVAMGEANVPVYDEATAEEKEEIEHDPEEKALPSVPLTVEPVP